MASHDAGARAIQHMAPSNRCCKLPRRSTSAPDICTLGFRKSGSRAWIWSVWSRELHRVGSSLAHLPIHTSVRHEAAWNAMCRRGVPVPISTTYLRDMTPVKLVFVHVAWRATQVSPAIGSRHGCNLFPVIFRWRMEDSSSVARAKRQSEGQDLAMHDTFPELSAWADYLNLFAGDMYQLEAIIETPQGLALSTGRLRLRPEESRWTQVLCEDAPAHRAQGPRHLRRMQEVQASYCLWVPGAQVQDDGKHGETLRLLIQRA